MRVAVVGGGPGGLFLAALLRRDPSCAVTVFERNRADDTFGFGVVFSDRALAGIDAADPVLRETLGRHGRHWDAIEVRLKGERVRCGGNGMAAVRRHSLLRLMQARAAAAGADLRFSVEVDLPDLDGYDLVVAADGTGSRIRERLADVLRPRIETATAKFIWFGTDYAFDGLTFVHERGPHGVFAVHGYPIGTCVSTFIVETDEASWRAAGLDEFDTDAAPGPSDEKSRGYLEELFAEQIDGHGLLVNNSRWGNFRTRRTERWHVLEPRAVALLGDAVHTAHFSVGSGTTMAMTDAIALADALTAHPGDLPAALAVYEAAARPAVDAIQGSARPSLSWWERFGRYHDAFEPWQFAYHFLSRSISDARLARRDPGFVRGTHEAWTARHGAAPLATPLSVGGVRLPGRLVEVVLDGDGDAGASGRLRAPDGTILPLHPARERRIPAPGAWGALVRAPDTETGLDAAVELSAGVVTAGAVLAGVHGGTGLTRTLLCEHIRLDLGVPALLVEPDLDRDRAVTAVLSGRADLVGADPTVAG